MSVKVCGTCKKAKGLSAFSRFARAKDGLQSKCKDCYNAYCMANRERLSETRRAYHATNRERLNSLKRAYYEANKEQHFARHRAYIARDRESEAKRQRAYADANLERISKRRRARYDANREKIASQARAYYAGNKHLFRALNSNYRAAKRNAMPRWLTRDHRAAIADIYRAARELESALGIKVHVDHMVPLIGKMVCGLHVPWNLRLSSAVANASKGNRVIDKDRLEPILAEAVLRSANSEAHRIYEGAIK